MENTTLVPQDFCKNAETLLLNDYSYYTYKPSAINPTKQVKSELRLICPRCNNEQKCPPYGQKESCPQCGLVMYIHGSELVCFL